MPATKFVSVPVTPSSAPGAYHDDAAKGEEVSSLHGRRLKGKGKGEALNSLPLPFRTPAT